jgi:hypothetical protein
LAAGSFCSCNPSSEIDHGKGKELDLLELENN